jgi:hypothetical protein
MKTVLYIDKRNERYLSLRPLRRASQKREREVDIAPGKEEIDGKPPQVRKLLLLNPVRIWLLSQKPTCGFSRTVALVMLVKQMISSSAPHYFQCGTIPRLTHFEKTGEYEAAHQITSR